VLEFNRLFGNQGITGGGGAVRDAIVDYLHRQSTPTGPSFPSNPANHRLSRVA